MNNETDKANVCDFDVLFATFKLKF